tara:strand:+ start:410 stop:1051 length:642 start_codon:yes stop_codon:yes gene_type:complete
MEMISTQLEFEVGKVFKFEVGPIKVTKKLYMPTVKRFEKWLNIIEKEEYFDKFDFLITGSFPNHINKTATWRTWDIDIVLIDDGDNSLEEIRETLIHMSKVALKECDFYLDTYYQHRKNVQSNMLIYTGGVKQCQPYRFEKKGLAYAPHVKRDDEIVSNWNIGEEVIRGLWVTKLKFPSTKQMARINKGFKYDDEIYLKEYKKYFTSTNVTYK